MDLKTLLQSIHEDTDTSSAEELRNACKLITRAEEMKAHERDVVIAAFRSGPLYDGDVPSKAGRDALLADGFIAKVVVKGEDGFNALTYKGLRIYRILQTLQRV